MSTYVEIPQMFAVRLTINYQKTLTIIILFYFQLDEEFTSEVKAKVQVYVKL